MLIFSLHSLYTFENSKEIEKDIRKDTLEEIDYMNGKYDDRRLLRQLAEIE